VRERLFYIVYGGVVGERIKGGKKFVHTHVHKTYDDGLIKLAGEFDSLLSCLHVLRLFGEKLY
jgi:hypothetical protein